ncbi:MAG TPA: LCP family protein [Fimbriimonadaceae bacterium]|nr:LCP family protein [Fimbriimonadaceae bacterium]
MAGKIFGAIWYVVVCAFFLGGGSAFGWLGRSKKFTILEILSPPQPPQATFHSDVQTFLILGCDEDYTEKSYPGRFYGGEAGGHRTPDSSAVAKPAARSDMMMVARMDFAKGEITGVSIPRDTWCRMPEDTSTHKINSYYHNAPPGQEAETTKKAVEYLIGVTIDKVIVIDFNEMQKLVDMLGGVVVNVPRKMDYDDNAGQLHIHLTPGRQRLTGYQAMGYVRFRHSQHAKSYETDFQRQEREKDMLLGLKNAMVSNWSHLPEIMDAGEAVVGQALDKEQIKSLAGFVKSIGQQNIHIGVIPTHDEGNGLELEVDKLPKVLAEYKLAESPQLTARQN